MANLLSAANSGFEDGTIGDWSAFGPVLSNSTNFAHSGTHALKTVSPDNDTVEQILLPTGLSGFPVPPNTSCDFGGFYRTPVGTTVGHYTLYAYFFDGTGALLPGEGQVDTDEVASATWTEIAGSIVTPVDAATATLVLVWSIDAGEIPFTGGTRHYDDFYFNGPDECAANTVWYSYTPSTSGVASFFIDAYGLSVVMEAFTGDDLLSLDGPVASYEGNDPLLPMTVDVTGGTNYWIRVYNSVPCEAGPFTLTWDFADALDPVVVDLDPVAFNSRLGCSQHVAYIQGKCNGARLCELLDISSLGYDRRLDDISEAFVEIPISGDTEDPCCSCLADVEPWCHVLTIVREGDGVVWTGPVQTVTYGYNTVRIDAKDKLAWLKVRINEIPIDYSTNFTTPLTTIAKTIAQVAMADDGDSPCFMDCVLDLGDGLPAGTDRSREIFQPFGGPTAFDDFQKMAESGVDYTVINQCLILGPETLPNAPIGTLLDEHILGDISITKNGNLLGNRFFVRYANDEDCVATCTPQGATTCPCPAEAEGAHECYGSVERLVTDDLGLPNVDAATQVAQSFLNASRLVPRQIEFPSGTRLSPDTPWGMNDMIPGQRVDVALSKLCIPIFQSFKLQQVSVEDGPEGEQISIDLQTLNVVLS